MLWPPQRTPISRSRSRARRTAAATSSIERQRAIRAGRRSIMAFQTDRAESYPGRAGGEQLAVERGGVHDASASQCIGTSDKNRFRDAFEDQFVTGLAARDRSEPRHGRRPAPADRGVDPGRASAPVALPAGIALPPTRALADELGVSRGVVVEAYAQLVAEGYLTSRSGSYTHVAPRATASRRRRPRRRRPTRRRRRGGRRSTSATAAATCRRSREPRGCARSAACSPRRPTSDSATSTDAERSSCARRSRPTSTGCAAPRPTRSGWSSPTATRRRCRSCSACSRVAERPPLAVEDPVVGRRRPPRRARAGHARDRRARRRAAAPRSTP